MNYSYYNLETGIFTGRRFSGKEAQAELNLKQGEGLTLGAHDRNNARFDIDTGFVVDYQSPSPGDDYEWSVEIKAWYLKPEVFIERRAQREIERLERGSLRSLRELLLDPEDVAAKARIQAIDDSIQVERTKLRRPTPAG